ncbi:unnamed protein product [Gongylonema pulchrum]|uniref:WH2 domain-containing protein n=1 Tax=Gongylonema pulchrum TaxID=637853 RepID=A0A183E2V6_9BILA|nr:unnamed protein product [Gongylonema pulchrum]
MLCHLRICMILRLQAHLHGKTLAQENVVPNLMPGANGIESVSVQQNNAVSPKNLHDFKLSGSCEIANRQGNIYFCFDRLLFRCLVLGFYAVYSFLESELVLERNNEANVLAPPPPQQQQQQLAKPINESKFGEANALATKQRESSKLEDILGVKKVSNSALDKRLSGLGHVDAGKENADGKEVVGGEYNDAQSAESELALERNNEANVLAPPPPQQQQQLAKPINESKFGEANALATKQRESSKLEDILGVKKVSNPALDKRLSGLGNVDAGKENANGKVVVGGEYNDAQSAEGQKKQQQQQAGEEANL